MRISRLFACVLFLALAISANAGPIISHSDVNGLGTFQDEATGRVWLRLDNFFDASYDSMAATAQAAGFTVAAEADVLGLLDTLPLTTQAEWDAYAVVMGDAPNRDLIWGAYLPTGDTQLWAWAYRPTLDGSVGWNSLDSGIALDGIPNAGGLEADMNLWAYQGGEASVPEPSSLLLAAFGAVALCIRKIRR
jgi:hypothetical protein